MKTDIKPMELKDLERVCTLTEELGYKASRSELQERFEEIRHLKNHVLLVASEDVQGFIHLEVATNFIKEKRVEIKALVVNENSRGQGIGRALLKAAAEWARSNRVSIIYLSCNIIRDRAHAFYLREGFIKKKTSHFFELEI